MDKISFSVEGLTREQKAELQSIFDTKVAAMKKENERLSAYLQYENSTDAMNVFFNNSKPTVSKRETWEAAITWAKANIGVL